MRTQRSSLELNSILKSSVFKQQNRKNSSPGHRRRLGSLSVGTLEADFISKHTRLKRDLHKLQILLSMKFTAEK